MEKNEFKKRLLSIAKQRQFDVRAGWIVINRTDDVVCGMALDSPPSRAYLWRFVLPAFDLYDFLHLSLGARIANSTMSVHDIEQAVANCVADVSPVKTAADLIEYIKKFKIGGQIAEWTRFICYVRMGLFEEAEKEFELIDRTAKSAFLKERWAEILPARAHGGWPCVQGKLREWAPSINKFLPRQSHVGRGGKLRL